jgi:hypothetical protein
MPIVLYKLHILIDCGESSGESSKNEQAPHPIGVECAGSGWLALIL